LENYRVFVEILSAAIPATVEIDIAGLVKKAQSKGEGLGEISFLANIETDAIYTF
jgi:ribosome-binding ATPase YchF (GTP1/OBG family)